MVTEDVFHAHVLGNCVFLHCYSFRFSLACRHHHTHKSSHAKVIFP
jgi:hypothetical protein